MSAQNGAQALRLAGQDRAVPTRRPAASPLTLSGAMLSDEWVSPAPGHFTFNLEAALLGIRVRSATMEIKTSSYEDAIGPGGPFCWRATCSQKEAH